MGRRLLLILLLSFSCVPGFGQKSANPKLSYKLLAIRVSGASQLKEDQIIAASGLKIGQFAGEADFQQAMKTLGDTGLFTNLNYSYHYSPDGCDVEFQVVENTQLVPIVFDNLVWLSDDDLLSRLHARLPLFTGRLPLGGDLPDQVADSLNAILAERKIAGKIDYIRAGPQDGPIDSFIYKISFHPVLIRNTGFPGADAAELPLLQSAAKDLAGRDFLRTELRPHEKYDFLPVYLARGFLKAAFSDAQAAVAEDGPRTLVDVSFPVAPGTQYKLTGIQWQGNTVLPADKLQQLVELKNGEPANAVRLKQDLDAVRRFYGSKGYINASIHSTPVFDDAQSTVAYELSVTEGDLYRMGDLLLDGLDADSTKRMVAQWQMKKGDPYDTGYLRKFFSIMYRDVGLSRPYNVVPKESVNHEDKTVSVALHFLPKG